MHQAWIRYDRDLRRSQGLEYPPRNAINIFDLAGNIVYSVDTTKVQELMEFFGLGSGPLEVSWDMKNQSGTPVASGIYVGVAEIYINRQKMAQGTGKVAIIR